MAVIDIIEQWQGRGATTDEKGVRTLKRQWVVTTDSDLTWEPTVIDAVIAVDPSAALYASHPAWPWALCREITADPNGGPRVWTVQASYSTAPFEAKGDGSGNAGSGTPEDPGNPTSPSASVSNDTPADLRPPTLSITRKEVTKVLEKDVETGDRVLNNVGDPFDPLPEVFRSHHLITWKFFRAPADLSWGVRGKWLDSINDDDVVVVGRTYPPHSLRCVDYSITSVWETGALGLSYFWEVTVQAEYDPDLWDVEILNTGRRKRIAGSVGDPDNPPRLVAIVDEHGQPVADPVPLGAGGEPLGPDDDPVYVTVAGYKPFNWNGVGGTLTGAGGILG
jgi:hypothetical protein